MAEGSAEVVERDGIALIDHFVEQCPHELLLAGHSPEVTGPIDHLLAIDDLGVPTAANPCQRLSRIERHRARGGQIESRSRIKSGIGDRYLDASNRIDDVDKSGEIDLYVVGDRDTQF